MSSEAESTDSAGKVEEQDQVQARRDRALRRQLRLSTGDNGESNVNQETMPPKSNGGAAPGTSGALAGGGAAAPLDFDMEDGVDGPDAINKVPNVAKIEYDADNVARWLNRLEIRMEIHGINSHSQFAKRCCLETALPPHIQPDLNEKWDTRKSKAGKTIYYDCKQLLLKLHQAPDQRIQSEKPSNSSGQAPCHPLSQHSSWWP